MARATTNATGAGVEKTASMKPIERRMPSVAYIVARSNPGDVIGCENHLPWRLKTDMKFFRSVTEGHVVIMGRKTFESLGRPLPKRLNIVISRSPGQDAENLLWADSPEMALHLADFFSIIKEKSQIIVIGGAQIYKMFCDQFTKVYLTEVFHSFECGDAYFNQKFDLREWSVVQEKEYEQSDDDEFPFKISVLDRKNKYTRHRKISEFFVGAKSDRLLPHFPVFRSKIERDDMNIEEQIKLPLLVA